jgi:phosphoglycolate phosphatase
MKGVVFDLDGTLIHSAPDLHAAAARMMEDFGRPAPSLVDVISFVGNGIPMLVSRVLAHGGAQEAVDHDAALARFRAHYLANPSTLTETYDGVLPMLEILKGEGFKLGICTNKSSDMTLRIVADLELAPYFDAIVGGDALAVRKPQPDPLRLAFGKLGLRAEGGLYVGDSEVDAATARATGSIFALYTGGYRKTAIEDFPTDFVFDRFDELPPYILARFRSA